MDKSLVSCFFDTRRSFSSSLTVTFWQHRRKQCCVDYCYKRYDLLTQRGLLAANVSRAKTIRYRSEEANPHRLKKKMGNRWFYREEARHRINHLQRAHGKP